MVKLVSHPHPRLEPPVVSLVEINVSAPVRKTTSATYDGIEEEREVYENNAAKREDVLGGKGKKKFPKFGSVFSQEARILRWQRPRNRKSGHLPQLPLPSMHPCPVSF